MGYFQLGFVSSTQPTFLVERSETQKIDSRLGCLKLGFVSSTQPTFLVERSETQKIVGWVIFSWVSYPQPNLHF
ncbi:hypothetical protein WN50_38615 [Limnoraphis robusta CS-951]|uniref:Uncharacterized protein n=1 Tax=Limnoraphis robusta CS-951 TaxID=1637645 RepID=A0A0J9HLA9_9CYAN|nr:hypothetical protein WN50_38615 [Limnoraphis robusta CS-951]